MNEPLDHGASDMNTADITAIVAYLISLGIYIVGSANSSTLLVGLSMAIGIPAVTLKVLSSRAKSRRWHQWMASRREAQEGDAAK